MKRLFLSIILFSLCGIASGQKPAKGPDFDIEDFNRKFEVVQWLVEYDHVAWKTTDVLMEQGKDELDQLGGEWFCFKDSDGVWNAVYGKLTDSGYNAVFLYTMDSTGKIARVTKKIDQDFLDRHARALSTARKKLVTSIPANSPRFNQYIRQNTDKTLSVWLLPAFQSDGTAAYGGEATYTIDATGVKIIKEETYFQPNFRGFKSQPPREIWLTYRELKKPSLGAIFFVWYYKTYFTKIFIDNETSTSSVVKAGDEYIWVHVEKDQTTKPEPK